MVGGGNKQRHQTKHRLTCEPVPLDWKFDNMSHQAEMPSPEYAKGQLCLCATVSGVGGIGGAMTRLRKGTIN